MWLFSHLKPLINSWIIWFNILLTILSKKESKKSSPALSKDSIKILKSCYSNIATYWSLLWQTWTIWISNYKMIRALNKVTLVNWPSFLTELLSALKKMNTLKSFSAPTGMTMWITCYKIWIKITIWTLEIWEARKKRMNKTNRIMNSLLISRIFSRNSATSWASPPLKLMSMILLILPKINWINWLWKITMKNLIQSINIRMNHLKKTLPLNRSKKLTFPTISGKPKPIM